MKAGVMYLAKLYHETMSMGRWRFIHAQIDPNGEGSEHLKWMIDQLVENGRSWPVGKSNRWLGYIQCLLVSLGVYDLATIRAQSKEAFREEEA